MKISYYIILSMALIISSCSEQGRIPIYGCTDPNATNFDPDSDIDDFSCECYDFNSSTVVDCYTSENIYFFNNIYQIFNESGCLDCHMGNSFSGLDLSTYEGVLDGGILDLSNPSESVIFTTFDFGGSMNSSYGTDYSLSNEELVLEWILQGAPE